MYLYLLIVIITTTSGVSQQSYEFADKQSCESTAKHMVDTLDSKYSSLNKPKVTTFCEPHSLTKY